PYMPTRWDVWRVGVGCPLAETALPERHLATAFGLHCAVLRQYENTTGEYLSRISPESEGTDCQRITWQVQHRPDPEEAILRARWARPTFWRCWWVRNPVDCRARPSTVSPSKEPPKGIRLTT